MKAILVLILTAVSVYGQTFKVCEEKKTDKTLTEVNGAYLIRMVYGPSAEASSLKKNLSYVPTNQHPVIYAAHTAFADHRRLVLSPDIVWLMISQGFATHIRINAEEFRKELVNFKGKKELEIRRDSFRLSSPDNDWSGVIDEFSSKIKTNKNLEKIIIGDFSTTDAIALTAYQLAHMDSVSKYFDYSMSTLCGIPEITLEGTKEDWEKVLKNVELLREYKLGKWVNGLKPILQEFVNASKGKVNKNFWQSIYKIHEKSGGPYITGWLLNFFPYTDKGKVREIIQFDKDMKMSEVKKSHYDTTFPKGQSKVPFIWKYFSKNIDMELNGGFLGVIQNKTDMSVKANIAWSVTRKNDIKLKGDEIPKWVTTILYLKPGDKVNFKNYPSVTYLDSYILQDSDLKGINELRLLNSLTLEGKYNGEFLKYLQELTNLTSIECEWNLKNEYLPFLESLNLAWLNFDKKANLEILKFLPKRVIGLTFENNKLTSRNISNLTKCKHLKSIYFSNCSFSEEAIKLLAKLDLEVLYINKCEFHKESLEQSLALLKNLKSLTINNCTVNSLTIKNPLLNKIELRGNQLSSISLAAMDNLKSLRLDDNSLTKFNLINNSITNINLSGNNLSELKLETPVLNILNVAGNKLSTLPKVSHYPIDELDASANLLKELSLPKNISSLYLNNIPLDKAMKEEISKCIKLTNLLLYKSNIQDNDSWIFKDLSKLDYLILSKEEIKNDKLPWLIKLNSENVLYLRP